MSKADKSDNKPAAKSDEIKQDDNQTEKEEKKEYKKKEPLPDYKTALLQFHYTNNTKNNKNANTAKLFDNFWKALTTDKNPLESEKNISQEMFVKKLLPLIKSQTLWNMHKKLAVASFKFTHSNTEKKEDDKTISIINEKYASALRFDLSPTLIKSLTKDIKNEVKLCYDKIANLKDDQLTTENVLTPMIILEQQLSPIESSITFLQQVSNDKDVRDASNECEVELSQFYVDIGMRKDVYEILKKYDKKIDKKTLNKEWERYLEKNLLDFKRNGLDLNDNDYKKVKEIKKELSQLGSVFCKNLNEDDTSFIFTKNELDGMPDDYLNSRKQDDGKYKVTLKYPCLFPLLKHCKIPKTRQIMEKAFNSRCKKENGDIMEKLVQLRSQQAKLLGKESHSEYVLETRMAKKPKTVWDFLNDLNKKMEPIAKKDMNALLKLKNDECKSMKIESDNIINHWDWSYYARMREEKEFNVDQEKLKEYFPVDIVIGGALDIYQELLSLKFIQIKEEDSQFLFWDKDISLWKVIDVNTNELMGHFFLDLYPRKGKYGHACKIPLQDGSRIYDKSSKIIGKQYPIDVMLCNFPKATGDKPALLTHNDVVTFFHEFGHVMHGICGQPLLQRFSGTRVERDFVEAPSQMLENWCWCEKSLNRMSGHYTDNKKKIPKDLMNALIKSKNANSGLTVKRQLFFGIIDQIMHTSSKLDTTSLIEKTQKEIWGVPMTKDTNFLATFAHLAGGYDAQYYGYMWSEVYSADMFYTKFGDNNLFNKKSGMDYRTKILSYGGSRDAMDGLVDFLGRQPNNIAFLKSKGLNE